MAMKPIRTSKEKISTIDTVDGQLLFVTDDKKIYIDKDTERIEFGKDSLNTFAEGLEAKAFGDNTLATGKYSLASGNTVAATGEGALAFGKGTVTYTVGSDGLHTNISGKGLASGNYSFVGGINSTASGEGAVAFTSGTAVGDSSFAVCQGIAEGVNSVAIGGGVTAKAGIAMGAGITSSVTDVPVFGSGITLPDTVTSAVMYGTGFTLSDATSGAMSIGFGNTIVGNSAAVGTGLKTSKSNEFAIGNYNISDDTMVFTIGGGTSTASKNLLSVDTNDNIIGKNYVGEKFLNPWTREDQYILNEITIKDNNIYKCIEAHPATGEFDESKWTLLLSGASGIDFNALSTILTSGVLSGLTITPDEENENFDIAVTGIPQITIDEEGYWLINGERGDNPTKAKGDTGFSPSATVEEIENGATITIIDAEATTTATVLNGENGLTPHISETNKHWIIGEADTGVLAEGVVEINTDCAVLYITLLANGWSNTAPYTQTVIVSSISETNMPIVDLKYSDDNSLWEAEEKAYGYLTKMDTQNGSITAICRSQKPEVDINLVLRVSGDVSAINFVTTDKFESTIGDINTILASVTGGIT